MKKIMPNVKKYSNPKLSKVHAEKMRTTAKGDEYLITYRLRSSKFLIPHHADDQLRDDLIAIESELIISEVTGIKERERATAAALKRRRTTGIAEAGSEGEDIANVTQYLSGWKNVVQDDSSEDITTPRPYYPLVERQSDDTVFVESILATCNLDFKGKSLVDMLCDIAVPPKKELLDQINDHLFVTTELVTTEHFIMLHDREAKAPSSIEPQPEFPVHFYVADELYLADGRRINHDGSVPFLYVSINHLAFILQCIRLWLLHVHEKLLMDVQTKNAVRRMMETKMNTMMQNVNV